MKKKCVGIILGAILLSMSFGMTAFARENSFANTDELYCMDTVEKTAVPQNGSRATALVWNGKTELYAFSMKSRSFVTKKGTDQAFSIGKIEVISKVYEKNSIKNSDAAVNYNASSVELRMGPYAGISKIVNREVYSTHRFTHSGYETGILETHAYK